MLDMKLFNGETSSPEEEEQRLKKSWWDDAFTNAEAYAKAAYANTRELGMGRDIKDTFDKINNKEYSSREEYDKLIQNLDRLEAERNAYRNQFQENQQILNQNDSMLKDFTEVGGTLQGIGTQAKDTAIGFGTGAAIGSAVPILGTSAGAMAGAKWGNRIGAIHQAINDADMNAIDAWEKVLNEGGTTEQAEQAYKDAFWANMPTEASDILTSMYFGGKLTGAAGNVLNRVLGGRLAGTLAKGASKVSRFDLPAKVGTYVANKSGQAWLGQGVGIGLSSIGNGIEERIQEPWQDYATERAVDIQRRQYDPENKLKKDVRDFSVLGEGGLLDYYTTPEGMETGWKAQKMGMLFGGASGLMTKSQFTELGTAHSDSIQSAKREADWIDKQGLLKDKGNLERYNNVKETMANIYDLSEGEKADLSVEDVARMYHEYYTNLFGQGGNRQEQNAVSQADFLNEITGEETARRGLMGDTATKYIDEFGIRPDNETLVGINDNQQELSEEQVQEALNQDEEETTGEETENKEGIKAKASKPDFFDDKTSEQAKEEQASSETQNVVQKNKKGIPDKFGNWRKIEENDDFDHDLNNIGAEAKYENTKTGRIANIKRTKAGYQVTDVTDPKDQGTTRNKKGKKKLLNFLKSSFANQKTKFMSDGTQGQEQVSQALPQEDGVIATKDVTTDENGEQWFNGKKIQSNKAQTIHSMQDLHDYYKTHKDLMSKDLYAEISRQMMRFGIGNANNTEIVLDLTNREAGGFGSETTIRTDPNDENSAVAKAIVRLYAGADLATAAHEMAHLGWMNLSDQDRATFTKWAEKTQGEFIAKILGMDYDQNFRSYLIEALTNRESQTSQDLWAKIKREGAVQQTLGILNGQNYGLAVEERFAWEFSNWYAQGYIKGAKPRNIIERILNKACATLQGALNLLSDTNRYLNGENGYNGGDINNIFTNMSTRGIGQQRQTVAPQEQVETVTRMDYAPEMGYDLAQGLPNVADSELGFNLDEEPEQNLSGNFGTTGINQKTERTAQQKTKTGYGEGVVNNNETLEQYRERMKQEAEQKKEEKKQNYTPTTQYKPKERNRKVGGYEQTSPQGETLEQYKQREAEEAEKYKVPTSLKGVRKLLTIVKNRKEGWQRALQSLKQIDPRKFRSIKTQIGNDLWGVSEDYVSDGNDLWGQPQQQSLFGKEFEETKSEPKTQVEETTEETKKTNTVEEPSLFDNIKQETSNKSVENSNLTSDNQNATMTENQRKQEVAESGETENTRGTEDLQGNVGEVQRGGSVRQGNDNRTGEGRVGQNPVEERSEGNGKDISLLKNSKFKSVYNARKEKKTEVKDWRDLSDGDEAKQVFVDALNASKEADMQHGVYVDGKTVEELKDCKVILHKNKMAGFAITPDGNIVGVFSNPKNPIRGILNDMIFIARMMGGNRMDCFGNFLLRGYRACGFTPVARTTFAEEYYPADNPANNTIRKEKPDVFFLVKDNDNNTAYLDKMNKGEYENNQIAIDDIPLIDSEDSYGDALGFQGQVLEEIQKKENKNKSTKEVADSLRPKEETATENQETTEQTKEEQTESQEETTEQVSTTTEDTETEQTKETPQNEEGVKEEAIHKFAKKWRPENQTPSKVLKSKGYRFNEKQKNSAMEYKIKILGVLKGDDVLNKLKKEKEELENKVKEYKSWFEDALTHGKSTEDITRNWNLYKYLLEYVKDAEKVMSGIQEKQNKSQTETPVQNENTKKKTKGLGDNSLYTKIGDTYVFQSLEDYLNWEESLTDEEHSEYTFIPTLVAQNSEVRADCQYDCKKWQTALKRFKKDFLNDKLGLSQNKMDAIKGWFDTMWESCENGYFEDHYSEKDDKGNPAVYSWGVDEVHEGSFYVYLTLNNRDDINDNINEQNNQNKNETMQENNNSEQVQQEETNYDKAKKYVEEKEYISLQDMKDKLGIPIEEGIDIINKLEEEGIIESGDITDTRYIVPEHLRKYPEYWAWVKYEDANGRKHLEIMRRHYPTKKAFQDDLKGNGMTVYFISTKENWDRDSEAYYKRLEENRTRSKIRSRTKRSLEKADKEREKRLEEYHKELDKELEGLSPEEKEKKIQERHDNAIKNLNKMLEDSKKDEKEKLDKFIERVKNDKNYRENTVIYVKKHSDGRVYAEAYTRKDGGYIGVTPEATIDNYNDYDSLYTLYPELLNEEDLIENDFEDKYRYPEDIYDEEGVVEAMFEDVSDSDAKTAQDVLQKKIDKETDRTRKSFYKKVMSKIGSYIRERESVSDDDGSFIKNLSGVGGGDINIDTSFGEQEFIDDVDSVYKRYLQVKKNENESKRIAKERDNLLKKWEEQYAEQEKRENYENGKKTINEAKEELKKTVNNWSDDFYEAMKNTMTEEEISDKPIVYHASMSKKVDGKNKIVEYNEIRAGKKKIRDLTEEEKKINAIVEKAGEAAQSHDDLMKELDTLIPERKQTSPETETTTKAKPKTRKTTQAVNEGNIENNTKTQPLTEQQNQTTIDKSDKNYQRAVELVIKNRGMSATGLRLTLKDEGIVVGQEKAEQYLVQMENDGIVEHGDEGSLRMLKKNPSTKMQEAGQNAENQTLLTPQVEEELENLFWKLIRKKQFHGMDSRWASGSLDYYKSLSNRRQGKEFNPEFVKEDKAFLDAIKKVNDYIHEKFPQYKNVYRGVDGHWRFEFSDKDAKFINGFEKLSGKTLDTTLDKILKHDNLYKFYSKLKGMPVHLVRNTKMQEIMEDTEHNYYAMYDPETKSIYVNSDMFESNDEVRNSLLHEIQHAIQDIEGFANGTNDNAYNNDYDFSEGEKQAVLTEKRSNMSDEELQQNPRSKTLNPNEKTIIQEQRPVQKVAKSPSTKMQASGQNNLGYIDKQKDIYSVTFTKSAQKNGENQKKIAFYRKNKSYWRENKDAQTGSITFTRALPYQQHQKTIIYDEINGKKVGKRKKAKWREYYEAFKDHMIKWLFNDKHFLEKAARNVGAIESYMRMMVMKDQGAVAGAAIEDGIVKHNGKNGERTKSLNSIIEAVGEENQTDFLNYCEAYRVLDLEKRNIYQKMTPDDARKEIAKVQRSKNAKLFEEQRKNFVEYNHELLWVLVDGGFITEKQYDNFIKIDPNFIPLAKNMDELEGYVDGFRDSKTMINVAHPMHKIGTSMREVANPFLEMQKRTVEYYVKASRNKAGHIFVHDIAEAIAQNAKGDVVAQNQGMVRKLASRDKNGKPISHDNKQYVFYVWENGEKQYYQVADREIYVALKSFDAEQMGALSKIMNATAGKASRLVRNTATMTPDFGLRNLVRDNMEAFISSEHGFLPLVDSLWGMYQMANDTQWFKEYQRMNGEHLSLNRDGEDVATVEHDIKDNVKFYKTIVPLFKKDLHEFMDKDRSMPARAKSLLKLVALDIVPLQSIYKANKRLNDYLETGTRIGEYRNARMGYKGLKGRLFETSGSTIWTTDMDLSRAKNTEMIAAYKSKDITLNFGQHGVLGKELNRYIPFFNASLQGIYKLGNTLDDMIHAEDARRRQELMFKCALMGAMGMAAALAGQGDDDYDEAPDYEHENFWILPNGIRIPKDQLFGKLIGGTVEKATAQYLKDGDVKKLELVQDILGNFAIDKCVPALVDLGWGTIGNYDSFKKKSVTPEYMADKLGYLQKDLSTSKAGADISKAIFDFTKGVFGTPVDVGAKKVDFVISKTLSNLGKYATSLWELTGGNEKMTRGAEVEDKGGFAETSKELPYPLNQIVGTFATNRNSFQSISDFYERHRELKKLSSDESIMSKNEKKAWEAYQAAYKKDKQYRDALKAIKLDKSLTGAQKRQKADKIFKQQISMARKLHDWEKRHGLV